MDFNFYLPKVNLLFGKGVSVKISEEIKKLGDQPARQGINGRALLVTGKTSMEQSGFTQKITSHLKNHLIEVTLFNKITPNPTSELVDEGAKVALKNNCNIIIGLGGGSAMDAAKAIAIVAGHSKDQFQPIWDFSQSQAAPKAITSQTLPIIAITSSSGTGSHVTRFSVITNPNLNHKVGIYSEYIFPKLSVVDLEILTYMPPALTAESGVDVLTHCLEGLVSKSCNPITEEMALQGIELVFNYLTDAFRNGENLKSREGMALADTYAGFVITTSRVILPHAMSHPISAFYPNISHGAALAALTPHIMQFNIEKGDNTTLQKYCLASGAMGRRTFGANKYEAMKSVEAVKELLEKIGMNKGLQELGVDPADIGDMVKNAIETGQGPINSNPAEVKESDIARIYKLAMGKDRR
ncbi:MAG: iron-containing alcohol dehydrogenase [Candidatus Ratteibacteria bacterium]|nr:iron-containing alcohol dehydrogenase [Candidatus Ratteibacteria bacterium]